MKVHCPSCDRVVPAAGFRLDREVLRITCAGCRAEHELEVQLEQPAPVVPQPPTRVDPLGPAPIARIVPLRPVTDAVRLAARAASQTDPFAVPDGHCPKCIAARDPDAQSCRQCGLVYVNFRSEEVAPSTTLSQVFIAALERWEDPAAHDAVLDTAARGGELPAAGRLYRIRLAESPHDLVAQKARDEIVQRAASAADLLRTLEPRDLQTPRWQWVVAVIVAVLAAGSVLLLVRAVMN